MRLDREEKDALRFALSDFKGVAYLFGSRLDETKKGGDIDILLISQDSNKIFLKCEQRIDVVVYDDKSVFCQEILKNAKRLDITRI